MFMMKKVLSILTLSTLSTIAFAAPDHGASHDMHDMSGHDMTGHDMTSMSRSLSKIGQPGSPEQVTRTIEIDMNDQMRFTPSEIKVEKGETIRFFLKNSGQLPHEMVIGSLADLQTHAIEMRKNPGMKHAEPNAITLNPGQRGGLVWKFDQAGTIDFACTIPGHMESGMVGKVQVS